jgi:hypothetical protein
MALPFSNAHTATAGLVENNKQTEGIGAKNQRLPAAGFLYQIPYYFFVKAQIY